MTNFLIRIFIGKNKDVTDNKIRGKYTNLAGFTGILLNVLLFIGKLVLGILAGSVAIIADAFNNISDAGSSVVTLIGFRLASKPVDKEHPLGHGRMEYVSGFIVDMVIILVGFELLKSSFEKILNPALPAVGNVTLCVLAAAILVKLWLFFFYKKIGKTIRSTAIKAAGFDSLSDAAATSLVLVSALIARIWNIGIDGYAGILVAAFILFTGIKAAKETIDLLLGSPPDKEFVNSIYAFAKNYPRIVGIHDVMVHDYGPGRQFASVHVEVAAEHDVLASHDMVDNIERDFLANTGIHMVVHMDPIVTADPVVAELRLFLTDTVTEIHPDLSIHDLRIVPGPTHTNVIFDCVVPADCPSCPTDVCHRIREKVSQAYPGYFCVITVDESFAPVQH